MNELGLPPTRQLPAEVRDRALHTVLSGMDSPQRRRLGPLLTAAAAVVAAVTVTTTVAVSAPGPESPGPEAPGLEQLSSGPPVVSSDPLTDNALTRCADAVVARNRAADYPPTSEWRTTEVLLTSPGGDVVIAVNDSFACFVGMSNVWVSSTRGAPAGAASIALLTPANIVILNPDRRRVDIVPGDGFIDYGQAPDAPVQLIGLGVATGSAPSLWLTVPGSYDGLMPDPGPVGVVVEDHRPMPTIGATTTTAKPPGPR